MKQLGLLKSPEQPLTKILGEIPTKDPKSKACPKHSKMPLQYLCHVDRQRICTKCLNKDHKGHQVTELETVNKVIQEKRSVLQQRESEWDREHLELDSLLEKRMNEELELTTGLFDELEIIFKKRRLELESKISLVYEDEKNRRERTYGEKCQIRQALRQRTEEYKMNFYTDIWPLLSEEADMKQFELNTELEDQELLEFDKLSETVNCSLKSFFQEQVSKLNSLSLPHDELMFFKWPEEVEEKTSPLKVSSHFRITTEKEKLKIVLNLELEESCVLDLENWKDIKIVEFRFTKLSFDQDDLLILHYAFGQMRKIQTVNLIQEERKGRLNQREEEKEMEKNEGLIIEFMTLLFSRQQNLQDIGLVLSSAGCTTQVLRLLAGNILNGRALKTFNIDFKSFYISDSSIRSLWKILSICHESLESVRLDLSRVAANLPFEQALTLPNLKSFALMIDCGSNIRRTRNFIASSLQSMKGLEELGVILYSYSLVTEKFVVVQLFEQIEKIQTLTKLYFMIKTESYKHPVVTNHQDQKEINLCRMVSELSKSLHKMEQLSKFHFGYTHKPNKLSNRQEIDSFINECERKWRKWSGYNISGIE